MTEHDEQGPAWQSDQFKIPPKKKQGARYLEHLSGRSKLEVVKALGDLWCVPQLASDAN